MMAICMAVFLFFLSVALVATNRQDLSLSLSSDDRLRATLAAQSAVNFALQTMRTDSQWEQTLKDKQGQMLTGASWKVEVRPAETHLVEVLAQGSSGLVKKQFRYLMQEFRICDTLARQNLKPHLFAVRKSGDSNVLMMMGPSFTWSALTALPKTAVLETLTGAGGPLYMNEEPQQSPELLEDYRPTLDSFGMYRPNWGATELSVPPGFHTARLEIADQQLRWRTLPDPQDNLGSLSQPSGTPAHQTFQVGGQSVQVDTGLYQGAVWNAYVLDGRKAAAEGNLLYAHAQHYYFRGASFQNRPVPVGPGLENHGQMRPAIFENDSCILKFDGTRWWIVNDCLEVGADGSVTHSRGPRPSKSSLAVSRGKVFSLSQAPERQVLVAAEKEWTVAGENPSRSDFLVGYRGQPCVQAAGSAHYQNVPPPADSFPAVLAAMHGDVLEGGEEFSDQELLAEGTVRLRPSPLSTSVTIIGDEVFTTGHLQVSRPRVSRHVLLHYDGQAWQIWPNGFYQQLWTVLPPPRERDVVQVNDSQGVKHELRVAPLVMCGYQAQPALMRRYVPVAWRL